MKMKICRLSNVVVIFLLIMIVINVADGVPVVPRPDDLELKLDPQEAVVYAGDNVTFTCSYPYNVSFEWNLSDGVRPYKVANGMGNSTNGSFFWSKLYVPSVKRIMSGEITCSVKEHVPNSAESFLIVNGVHIGGICTNRNDCITDKATCQNGICSCPEDEVLLKITENGYEVCRKMIYRLYDPCEFSEQCFHLVDSKAVCTKNGICVCSPWSTEVNGKCVSKSEIAYDKNQELYRVGLVAITCLIIIVVALSMWMTLRRSCQSENIDSQLRSITRSDEQITDEISMEITEDKPPSYDDLLDSGDNISSSPPNFKEALTSSTTSKKFLRQSSAPAGQLLSTAVIVHHPGGKLSAQTSRKKGG